MPKIYVRDMPKIYSRFGRDVAKVWPRYSRDMTEIWPIYGKIMAKLLPRYGLDVALQKWDKMSPWRSWDKMLLRKNVSGEKIG